MIHVAQTDGERGRELLLIPHGMVHHQRTVTLVDRRRWVAVFRDSVCLGRPAGPDAARPSSAGLWERIKDLASIGGDDDDVDQAITEALIADPTVTLERLLEVLTEVTDGMDPEEFEPALGTALADTIRLRALRRAAVAFSRNAPQTARTHLALVGTENKFLGVRAALMEAALEFHWAGGSYREPGELALEMGAGGDERVTGALQRARDIDPEYTDQWLKILHNIDLGAAIGRLQHRLPSLVDLLRKDEIFAAWNSRAGVEAARIARSIEQAAQLLDEDGELHAAALAKLGLPLEESFLDEFAGANRDTAHELLGMLTSNERTFGHDDQGNQYGGEK